MPVSFKKSYVASLDGNLDQFRALMRKDKGRCVRNVGKHVDVNFNANDC